MVRLLIPIIDVCVVTEAVRHAKVLSRNTHEITVELLEILPPPDQGRVVAFHSVADQRQEDLRAREDAVWSARSMLDQAHIAYKLTRAFGPVPQVIAAFARDNKCDVVVIDASCLSAFRGLSLVTRLWRLTTIPITLLHAAKEAGSGHR
ncbi:universal stress protein [Caballeronia sordidicola]|uniref:universal stress protein n=1 Tax=Caballeronia sordidicola TaxID=196367 RepID=UPI000A3B4B2F